VKISKTTNRAVKVAGNPKSIKPVTAAKYADAKDCILSAIDILGNAAIQGDALAKESIANLSVVLLDLK